MNEFLRRSVSTIIKNVLPDIALRIAAEMEVDRDLRRKAAKGEIFEFAYSDPRGENYRVQISWDGHFLLDGKPVDELQADSWNVIQQAMIDIRERLAQTHINFLK